ncbi:hypothetical protein SPSIL_020060 [Sporomusa silvacetica DSM 10669]|uniref:Septation protein SpoVG n=1 Tax=Sporomusa silvacetica DSM 10669 TaxID=1123289 RepID=A0ABZ3IJJ2_9FIRM|nr:septation protein SpoVG family protein [Sporomusa silvacetica]OZC18741.1 hypothetical protein SPSIL_23500 [Sporomusa silvacetica DSM 10669]
MRITEVKYCPVRFESSDTVGYAQVRLDGVLMLYDIAVKIKDGAPMVVFPTRVSTRKGKVRSFFSADGPLRSEIDAAVIEQYELFNLRRETDINHKPVKAAGSNRRLVLG